MFRRILATKLFSKRAWILASPEVVFENMAAGSGLREDGGAGRSHEWRAEIMAGEDQQQLRNVSVEASAELCVVGSKG